VRGRIQTVKQKRTPSMRAETRDLRCRYCGRVFDHDHVFATFDGDRATYRCPHCGRWTPGPPPA